MAETCYSNHLNELVQTGGKFKHWLQHRSVQTFKHNTEFLLVPRNGYFYNIISQVKPLQAHPWCVNSCWQRQNRHMNKCDQLTVDAGCDDERHELLRHCIVVAAALVLHGFIQQSAHHHTRFLHQQVLMIIGI